MRKYVYAILLTFLIIAALILCIVLFEKNTTRENGAYFTENHCDAGMFI